jgi:hypothetical protein
MIFEILVTVTMEVVVVFWDVMMCSLVGVYQHLERPNALIFRAEDGGSAFFQNIGKHLADGIVTHPTRQ